MKGGWEGGGEKRPSAKLRDLINQPYMLLLSMGISSCVNHSYNHLSSPFPACLQSPPALWIFFWAGGWDKGGQIYTGYPTPLLSLISLCKLLSPSACKIAYFYFILVFFLKILALQLHWISSLNKVYLYVCMAPISLTLPCSCFPS